MRLREITGLRTIYLLPRDHLLGDVIIPSLRSSTAHDALVAFFHSGALREMAGGLAEFVACPGTKMRLLISPYLAREDQAAIKHGLEHTPEELAREMEVVLGSAEVTESALAQHTLTCLAVLIAQGRLEIKVVLVRDGLFHPKIRIFSDTLDTLVLSGSNNFTGSGLVTNVEQVTLFRSWLGERDLEAVNQLVEEFDLFWNGTVEEGIRVVALPEALRRRLIRDYGSIAPPTPRDFAEALQQDQARGLVGQSGWLDSQVQPDSETKFAVPAGLNYTSGPYAHQGRAIDAWEQGGSRGILEMATGAGKTKTSLIAARRLLDRVHTLLIVIAVPYLPLVDQWHDEARAFGLEPIVPVHEHSRSRKFGRVTDVLRRLRQRRSDVECLVVTHDFLSDTEFGELLQTHTGPALLIADEVHNLGRSAFIDQPPEGFAYRLGLSATPERQYDEPGTTALFSYFGDVVFRFTLREAIGVCLVPYDYFVHPVELTESEAAEWQRLTRRIRQFGWRPEDEEGERSDAVRNLLIKRRRVLEQAEGKIAALEASLRTTKARSVQHTLIYASDKGRAQLESVNSLLRCLSISFHQVTAEESAKRERLSRILERFTEGNLQVLTAMRVLDEGVDIPEIATGYILASTTVERQWVQRRGRLLRPCPRLGKEQAVIHDFLVLPPDDGNGLEGDQDTRAIVVPELRRIRAFAETAANAASPGGALSVIHPIVIRYL